MKNITIFVTILIVFCVTPIHPVIFFNYFCNNLVPECPAYSPQPGATTQDVPGYQENLALLQARAAAAFLTANANWQTFLAKIEMAEVQVDYKELSNILKKTFLEIEKAEGIFAKITEASHQYQMNPRQIEKLKSFDYKWFCAKWNLNQTAMSEVECYLSTGDILGLPNRFQEQLAAIKTKLKGFRQSVERNEPDINAMYEINQSLLTMSIYGQYAAMVFREVRFQ